MTKLFNWIAIPLREIGWILKQGWNDFANSGHCCGLGLQYKEAPRPEPMPSASSCCGVKF